MEPLHGLLEMLVLKTLIRGPLHGYGIAKSLHLESGRGLQIEFGSLYPALKRLEAKGWIQSKWSMSEHNRRAKYYRLTRGGRGQLTREHGDWENFVSVVARVMRPGQEGAG
jgi:transcriptional regulator